MRSSVMFVSALALGVVAVPHQRFHRQHRVITETAIEMVTIVVTITTTPGGPIATPIASFSSASPVTELKPSVSPPNLPILSKSTSSLSILSLQPAVVPTNNQANEPAKQPSTSPTPIPASVAPAAAPEPQKVPSALPLAPLVPSSPRLSGQEQAHLSSGPEYQESILYHHNAARANHGAGPLVWDSTCEANARLAAEKCSFKHWIPEGTSEGQNLFTVSGDAFNVTAAITESWYKGELPAMTPYFGQRVIPASVFHSVGHFTQLVWKNTTKVGCVSIDCGVNMLVAGAASTMNKYTVCNYAPAGNVGGGYADNVEAPISLTNLGGWAD